MKLTPKHERGMALLTVTSRESCDTDVWPMVPEIFFRQYQGTYDPELAAVASAILFGRYCGSVTEFEGGAVGSDAARAIRAIAPTVEDIMPIDGARRELVQGTSAIVVGEAGRLMADGVDGRTVGRATRVTTWSGDFVSPDDRTANGYIGGALFTNAGLVAGSTATSAALALLLGGRALRDIYVPAPPKAERTEFERIGEGLEFVGLKLHAIRPH